MPRQSRNGGSRQVRQPRELMFPITKNTSKPASTPSHSKKRRFYDLESDEESSNAADLDSGIVTRSRGNSLLRRRAIENETASPSTTVVVAKQSGKKKGFLSMPVELHQIIAGFLPEDRDVTRFRQVCRYCRYLITASVWRLRFLQTFDNVPGTSPEEFSQKYISRRGITRQFIAFDIAVHGHMNSHNAQIAKRNQQLCLAMLKNLIIECNAQMIQDADGTELIVGRNLDYIREFVSYVPGTRGNIVDIIDAILKTERFWNETSVCSVNASPDTLVMVIQLCLTAISLDRRYCNNAVAQFDWSQYEAYASPQRQPVFLGRLKNDLNVLWCLHVVNFFKFHLKAKRGEGILAHKFDTLPQDQLPRAWVGRLQQGTQILSSHWKGSYMFIQPNELTHMRTRGGNDDSIYLDRLNGEEFSDLSFFFNEQKFGEVNWSTAWEEILNSNPFSKAYATQRRHHVESPGLRYFYGSSQDGRLAHFFGIVHAIPTQHGIPGFQRITLMKFFPDKQGQYDSGEVWGYEGCVLPGGSIIVGRWWDATANAADDVFSGPFIFWNVARSEAKVPINGEAALQFLNLMRHQGF